MTCEIFFVAKSSKKKYSTKAFASNRDCFYSIVEYYTQKKNKDPYYKSHCRSNFFDWFILVLHMSHRLDSVDYDKKMIVDSSYVIGTIIICLRSLSYLFYFKKLTGNNFNFPLICVPLCMLRLNHGHPVGQDCR